MLLEANVNRFRHEIFLNNRSKQFQTKFEENIIFFNFGPSCTRTRGFSRHTFPAHFVGFLFWYFYRFLLFSLLLHEN